MSILGRLSRLFQADAHALMDWVEEPEALLKQSIREMEESLLRSEQSIHSLKHRLEKQLRRKTELTSGLDQLQAELNLCFTTDNEDLARRLIKRKLEKQKLLQVLQAQIDTQSDNLAAQQQQIQEHHSMLESMKQKQVIFEETCSSNQSTEGGIQDIHINDDEIELALLKEKQMRKQA